MKKSFIEELKWRGMLHDLKPGVEEVLEHEMVIGYLGIDPTADSLHIGHLVGVMMLRHLQECGHKPIALVGGATGMIGDPSGKSKERNLLDEATLRHNQECLKEQLGRFLEFGDKGNKALMVNNYDWMKDYTFLHFIRDIGKHITVNYMMAKDSVRQRLEKDGSGMSFTEFTYQLVQGYDFLHLYRTYGCKLQLGGSDQWGNITTGTELIRRIDQGDAFAITCPLITKSDGKKFGKTEEGNVWLDRKRTSPYKFYQFWLNVSDEDAERYIKIFTLFSKTEIEALINEHREAPHARVLQKALSREMTVMVHSAEDYEKAVEASEVLFGKGTKEMLQRMDDDVFQSVFQGVKSSEVERTVVEAGVNVVDLLSELTGIFASKAEVRRLMKDNGLSINQEKMSNPDALVDTGFLINGKYIVVRKGKKDYALILFN